MLHNIISYLFDNLHNLQKKPQSCNHSDRLFFTPRVYFVCINYAKATHLKLISNLPGKIIKQRFLLISRKRKLWHSIFFIELHTRFTPPSWIAASHKYVKTTICLTFYGVPNLLSQVRGTFKFFDLLLTTLVSRGGAKTPSMEKSTLGCPKKMDRQLLVVPSRLKVNNWGGGLYFPLKSWNPKEFFFFQRSRKNHLGMATFTLIVVFPALYVTNHLKTKYTTNTC